MKSRFFVVISFLSLSLLLSPVASAHTGSGPPFVEVNGELAETNPYFQGTSSINVPQDIVKTVFLPGEAIHFTIDPTKLTLPETVLNNGQFSWIFFTGDNFETPLDTGMSGEEITKTFSHPGSYLVNVYLTYQGDPQLLDTIQVNIIPYKGYSPPTTTVSVNTVGNTVFYLPNPHIDVRASSKKILWDIGDGKISEGHEETAFVHTYETSSFVSFLYNRVIDSNNLVTDVGFQTQSINGDISFVPFPNTPTVPFRVTKTKVPSSPVFIIIKVVLFILLFVLVLGSFLKWGIKKVY